MLSTLVASTVFAVGVSLAAVPADAQTTANNPITLSHVGVGATDSEMNFSWRTKYSGQEYVKYYPSGQPTADRVIPANEANYGALLYRSNHGTITGLRPGTEYTYQLGSDTGGWSEPATFRTQSRGDSWSFLAMADAQIGVNGQVAQQAEAWREAVKQATGKAPNAQFILHAGDQVEGWGSQVKQWEEFFSPEQVRTYPLALAMGNHERYPSKLETRHFNEHVNFPNRVDGTANYYFERNNALFIVLDSNESSDAAIANHAEFVRQTASTKGAGKDWIIAVMHHSPYTHSSHAKKDDDVKRLREQLSPVFSEAGVDLVIGGHDHMYNRSRLMNGVEPVDADKPAKSGDVLRPKKGEVLYLTSTTAGGGKYYHFHDVNGVERKEFRSSAETDGTEYADPAIAVWQQDYTPDYSVVDVSKHKLTVRTYNVADNSLVDEVTLDHSPLSNPGLGDGGGSSAEGSSTGAIVGIVIGVLAALLGGLALLAPQLRDLAARYGIRL